MNYKPFYVFFYVHKQAFFKEKRKRNYLTSKIGGKRRINSRIWMVSEVFLPFPFHTHEGASQMIQGALPKNVLQETIQNKKEQHLTSSAALFVCRKFPYL